MYTGIQTIQKTGTNTINIIKKGLDCITPWKEKVQDKDFILAYQQRKDVSSICNIEKRICNDGKL